MFNTSLHPEQFKAEPAPGRACGTCTLCCKVYDVPSVPKSMGKWCQHCVPGRGCGIHETRPDHCRAFHCLWMTENWLGPEWKPEQAKFVMTIDPVTRFLLIQLDPGQPSAWKREPYYSQLKKWSETSEINNKRIIVFLNDQAQVVLADRDVNLGRITAHDRLVFNKDADGITQVSKTSI